MKPILLAAALFLMATPVSSQVPAIEPGVPLELARWRAEHYSDIRYELSITLEKMAPTMKGTLKVEVNVSTERNRLGTTESTKKKGLRTEQEESRQEAEYREGRMKTSPSSFSGPEFFSSTTSQSSVLSSQYSKVPIILDWRRISGHERKSRITYVKLNGKRARFRQENEHIVFPYGVVEGKNTIELRFESPILTSGSAITRYVDKEDGSEYIYSLFVPSDASTAFPVFDQPDLKARFNLKVTLPKEWNLVTNGDLDLNPLCLLENQPPNLPYTCQLTAEETKPISTYVFAFAAGPFEVIEEIAGRRSETGDETQKMGEPRRGAMPLAPGEAEGGTRGSVAKMIPSRFSGDTIGTRSGNDGQNKTPIRLFVRKSQANKLIGPPQAADAGRDARGPGARGPADEVFRLNREALDFLSDYFDYPYPFPKYDVVLIPEFPFGGMEHAGATFLRETSVIFPTEPTANNYISRATVIFHEAAHQWFGDTVTMKWFDDLWLKEGFATFMAYKAMEKIMPEYDAWKVFYQRVKPAAYSTDVTKGTVPIYQDIPNLNSAKSAYGAIVYQKAPSFLRQAEFYLGEEKFRQAVRDFLKANEYSNATWSDLVGAFEKSSGEDLEKWADVWVKKRSLPIVRLEKNDLRLYTQAGKPHDNALVYSLAQQDALEEGGRWPLSVEILMRFRSRDDAVSTVTLQEKEGPDKDGFARFWTYINSNPDFKPDLPVFVYPNYRDFGYGVFLLDEESRNYILNNIRSEQDDFLRAQMWGSLWDSVRFAELAPIDYVNLAIDNIEIESDDTTISSILGRTAYAFTYYLSDKQQDEVAPKLESLLIDKMRSGTTVGQRITYYRALLGVAKGEKAREALKELFRAGDRRQEAGDGKQETGEKVKETGDSRQETGVPRRGAVPVAPGAAEGGTRGAEGQLIPSRFSGGTNAGRDARGPEEAGRDARGPGSLSTQYSSLSTSSDPPFPVRPKDRFDIAARLIEIGDPDGGKMLAELEKSETDDAALRWAYAAKAAFATAENKEKFWKDFTENKEISESWIEEAAGAWNSPSQAELTLPYLAKALGLLPSLKRDRKIFFVNNWLGVFIGGQKSREALEIVNRFLAENPGMDADLKRKILENVDGLERAVTIRTRFGELD